MVRNHFRNKNYLHVRWGGSLRFYLGFWWFPPCSHCVPNRFPTMLPMYSPSSQCVSFLTPQASNLFLGIGIICMLGGGGVWDFIWVLVVPIVFSLCSQKVPNYAPSVFPKFPMCSQQVPNAFPTGSQCGPPSPPPKKIKPKFSTTLRGGHHPRKFEACGADFGYSFWRDSWVIWTVLF